MSMARHGADVKQLGVELHSTRLFYQGAEVIYVSRVGEQQGKGGFLSRTISLASRASVLSGTVTPEIEIVCRAFGIAVDISESPFNCTGERSVLIHHTDTSIPRNLAPEPVNVSAACATRKVVKRDERQDVSCDYPSDGLMWERYMFL
jgi:hypothetical protein